MATKKTDNNSFQSDVLQNASPSWWTSGLSGAAPAR